MEKIQNKINKEKLQQGILGFDMIGNRPGGRRFH